MAGEVFDLLFGEGVDVDAHGLELEFGDPGVDFGGDVVDLGLEGLLVLEGPFGGEGLDGEGHVHDGGGVAVGGGEVNEAAFAEDHDGVAGGDGEAVDEFAEAFLSFLGHLGEGDEVEFDVEVAGVTDQGAVFHDFEVFAADDVDVAGDGDKDVAFGGGFFHRHDLETVHDGFDGFDGIDFGDDHVTAEAAGAGGDAFAAVAVAGDDDGLAGDEVVGGADDAVQSGLAGAVAVVEKVLTHGVVDGHGRELKGAISFHGLEADDAGGRFFHRGDDVLGEVFAGGVEEGDEIAAVVHGDVGLDVEGGVHVTEVGVAVFAFDGVDVDAVLFDECGGIVILGGEGVGGAGDDFSAAGDEGAEEVGGLRSDVETGAHAVALEGLFLGEALADGGEDGHVLVGPFDAFFAFGGEGEVFDVVVLGHLRFLSKFNAH